MAKAKNILKKNKKRAKKLLVATNLKNTSANDMGMGGIATKTFNKSQLKSRQRKVSLELSEKIQESVVKAPEAEKKEAGLGLSVVNPADEVEVGELVCRYVKSLYVDVRSIGGMKFHNKEGAENTSNILLQQPGRAVRKKNLEKNRSLINECLFCMRIGKFEITGGNAQQDHMLELIEGKKFSKKAKNKLRYVCVIRSTNRPLLGGDVQESLTENVLSKEIMSNYEEESQSEVEDDNSAEDYDKMFNPDAENDPNAGKPQKTRFGSIIRKVKAVKQAEKSFAAPLRAEDEISSFPVIVFLALHPDGTCPDVRRIIRLENLNLIQCSQQMNDTAVSPDAKSLIELAFKSGETVQLDLQLPPSVKTPHPDALRRDSFLWTLLQIHAILCTAVVERQSEKSNLPFLNTDNIDKADLQYTSTVHGFLNDNVALRTLLDRQRNDDRELNAASTETDGDKTQLDNANEVDTVAYDMMMGNYSRYAIFQNPEEERDAEEILNHIPWQKETFDSHEELDPSTTAESLTALLQKKMRDLEAETCRRLIAWEDEKKSTSVDCADSVSLLKLFDTLEKLDGELASMEQWLEERSDAIEPLMRDCQEVEEENRQLEQQSESYMLLGQDMMKLLSGMEIDPELEAVLQNPKKYLQIAANGTVDLSASEKGVELIHSAGMALKEALQKADREGCVYLNAIRYQVEYLLEVAKKFCDALARVVVGMMEQLASSVISDLEKGKISKEDSHTLMVKKIRDTQKRFQSSLFLCFKFIEVLYYLSPDILIPMRDAYAELVANGILSKKRMKKYFSSLPCIVRSGAPTSSAETMDLKDYHRVILKPGGMVTIGDGGYLVQVNTEDVQLSLKEMLPVIAREAYFTAVIFGPPTDKKLDGREKKRNFEAVKKSVDRSSIWFRYYMYRVCGIAKETDSMGKQIEQIATGNPMLALVSVTHLNESMENFIDHEKKGGVQSLSLAYVRATIFDLRKKVEKEWSRWVEEQIKWIRTNHGVPADGKRAGVFDSFAFFPAYLDHVLLCCSKGRSANYIHKLAKMKVVAYYLQKMAGELFASLHECAERETTDQQYAANVMRMENSYFFSQTIRCRGEEYIALFQKQINAANTICKRSTDAYLGWMIKREFKQLHNLFSNISRVRKDVGDADVHIHVPKATFIKTLAKESNREVLKEKIKAIYSRMEKHLDEASGLLPVSWKALVKVLYEWFGRWEKLSSTCYQHKLEPSAVDVVRIAKAAGGGVSSAPSAHALNQPSVRNGVGSAAVNV